jgi:hypothetical protein
LRNNENILNGLLNKIEDKIKTETKAHVCYAIHE